jgi:hypothetical protein
VTGRNKDATWRSLGTVCRERGWSQRQLISEFRSGGLRVRTIPRGHEREIKVSWSAPDDLVVRWLDIQRSEMAVIRPVRRADGKTYFELGPIVGLEVSLPAADAEVPSPPGTAPAAAPAPPVERWSKPPPADKVKKAALAVAKTFKADDPPTEAEWWAALDAKLGERVKRKVARGALADWAKHLKRRPGQTKRNRRS